MGRELRRKQAKKEGKNLIKEELIEENVVKKYLKILSILIIIGLLIYIISGLFVTKEIKWLNKNNDDKKQNIIENSILASSIFKQSEEEYYVYFYDFKKEDTEISNLITTKLSETKVYRVDTSSAMNSNYISDKSNKNAKKLEELKVLSPTLIKIVGEEIVEYYENEEIITALN